MTTTLRTIAAVETAIAAILGLTAPAWRESDLADASTISMVEEVAREVARDLDYPYDLSEVEAVALVALRDRGIDLT